LSLTSQIKPGSLRELLIYLQGGITHSLLSPDSFVQSQPLFVNVSIGSHTHKRQDWTNDAEDIMYSKNKLTQMSSP